MKEKNISKQTRFGINLAISIVATCFFGAETAISAPTWSIASNQSITEGLAGTDLEMTFTVRLSEPSAEPCSVEYYTESITAIPGEYIHTEGIISYPAGINTNTLIKIPIIGNNILDGSRTFRLTLTNAVESAISATASRIGTINDRTGFTLPNVSVSEGDDGSETNLTFVLSLTTPNTTQLPVSVRYETVDILAAAGTDYTATSGIATFDTTQTVVSVQVPVFGNNVFQADRAFSFNVYSEPRGILIKAATGTILDDDAPARVGLQPGETLYASIFEGATIATDAGNPDFQGQSWYDFALKNKLLYFDEPARWAKSVEPGPYPDYLYYSYVKYDDEVPTALETLDRNSKTGVAWVYEPLYRGDYEIFFDKAYAYPNGGGNPQI
jgi:hypothetical protein